MSFQATCDDCGKMYTVPDASDGKRAKCKRCGHVFAVVRPRATVSAVEPEPEYRLRDEVDLDDWARTAAVASPSIPSPSLRPTRAAAAKPPTGKMGRWEVIACCGILAVAVGFAGVTWLVTTKAAAVALFALSGLALIYFLAATAVGVRQSLSTPGAWSLSSVKVPWTDVVLIGGQALLSAFVPLPVFVHRRRLMRSPDGKPVATPPFVKLILRSIGLALLGVGVLLQSMAMGHNPIKEWDADARQAAAELERRRPEMEATTAANLQRLEWLLQEYAVQHGGLPPTSMAELGRAVRPPTDDAPERRPIASPWDPAAGLAGYVYLSQNLPQNLPGRGWVGDGRQRPILYDAAELAADGRTHVVNAGSGDTHTINRLPLERALAEAAAHPLPPPSDRPPVDDRRGRL